MKYEQVPHTADLAARIYGRTLPELFENAAFAMFEMMLPGVSGDAGEKVHFDIDASDREELLVSWLNELLYASFEKKIFFTCFTVEGMEVTRLKASAKGVTLKDAGEVRREIKAATYHDVRISEEGKGYKVTVVFDV